MKIESLSILILLIFEVLASLLSIAVLIMVICVYKRKDCFLIMIPSLFAISSLFKTPFTYHYYMTGVPPLFREHLLAYASIITGLFCTAIGNWLFAS